jgi:hypothetical protein
MLFVLLPGSAAAAEIFERVGLGPSALDLPEPALWTPDGSSMATSDGPQAVFTNPAAIGLRSGVGFFYGGTRDGDKGTYNAFSLQVANLSFGYAESKAAPFRPETRSLLMGESFTVGQMLRIGTVGNWQQVEYLAPIPDVEREAFSWGAGLLFRPCRHFSLGTKLSNINQPRLGAEVLHRYYHVGAGVRPLGNRVTFTVDSVRS